MSKEQEKIAIIDLGTNTFNLLIARIERNTWQPEYRASLPVYLAQGGIGKNVIAWDRFARGLDAMWIYSQTLSNYKCNRVYAFATSAVREADNGKEFVEAIYKKTGIDVLIIDGDREAEFIYYGVSQCVDLPWPSLVMDIGGGSTEFILCAEDGIRWKGSFPLGVSRIAEVLQPPDPLVKLAQNNLRDVLQEALMPLWAACKGIPVRRLAGSSGSFDTFFNLIQKGKVAEEGNSQELSMPELRKIFHSLYNSDLVSRLAMPGMSPTRAETIQISALLTEVVLEKLGITEVFRSSFALKEGALAWILLQEKENKVTLSGNPIDIE
jgi:exopolyphosphatase/guanosine-5'-triphosphate,3'-diphosphate pyrophosphatase